MLRSPHFQTYYNRQREGVKDKWCYTFSKDKCSILVFKCSPGLLTCWAAARWQWGSSSPGLKVSETRWGRYFSLHRFLCDPASHSLHICSIHQFLEASTSPPARHFPILDPHVDIVLQHLAQISYHLLHLLCHHLQLSRRLHQGWEENIVKSLQIHPIKYSSSAWYLSMIMHTFQTSDFTQK